jgi:hypothetical protein
MIPTGALDLNPSDVSVVMGEMKMKALILTPGQACVSTTSIIV